MRSRTRPSENTNKERAWGDEATCTCVLFFPSVSQNVSHLDVFNQMLPVVRKSIAGSVDGLCMDAIAMNLMTFPERAGILEGGNKFIQASQFLEHFALKIEVSPEVLFQFMDMLTKLGTCDGVVQEISKL